MQRLRLVLAMLQPERHVQVLRILGSLWTRLRRRYLLTHHQSEQLGMLPRRRDQ